MKSLIVANWKMNPATAQEAERLFNSVKDGLENIENACPVGSQKLSFGVETVICPPFVYLSDLKSISNNLKIGAQDCLWEKSGAFTGAISPLMLKDIGCQYVILGHSERRTNFEDTNEIINKKIKAALSAGLNVIFCFGETEIEKRKGQTEKVLEVQIKKGLAGVLGKEMENIVMAYEPVWAIGTGNPCSPEDARNSVLFIRKILTKLYPDILLESLKILYGGSVNSENAEDYSLKSGVQGFIVGGASLKPDEFIKIVKIVSHSRP
jgi:triosephosphate isomerase